MLAILSLVGALLALVAYGTPHAVERLPDAVGPRRVPAASPVAVLGIIAVLFIMLLNHWFEYDYVEAQQPDHAAAPSSPVSGRGRKGPFSLDLLARGTGQRPRIRKAREWEAPVMTVFALVQAFLATMLLGIYLGDGPHRQQSLPADPADARRTSACPGPSCPTTQNASCSSRTAAV